MSDMSQVKPLYIVWNQDYLQGRPIIDEQHRAILATINSLGFFIQQGYNIKFLVPTIKMLLNYTGFHYKTEEGILKSTEYPNLHHYIQAESDVRSAMSKVYHEAIESGQPERVLQFLGQWWEEHLKHHQEVTPYLQDWSGDYCRVDAHHDNKQSNNRP